MSLSSPPHLPFGILYSSFHILRGGGVLGTHSSTFYLISWANFCVRFPKTAIYRCAVSLVSKSPTDPLCFSKKSPSSYPGF